MLHLRRLLALVLALGIPLFLLSYWQPQRYGLLNFLRGEKMTGSGFREKIPNATLASAPLVTPDAVPGLTRLNEEFATLVAKTLPGVVSITTTQQITQRNPFTNQTRSSTVEGEGSGFIVTEEGHVVTNNHVIAKMRDIKVRTHDNQIYDATVVGVDEEGDIAVLRIKGKKGVKFTPLPFGDSDQARVAEMVFAVGSPFGLNESVTQGIISARERHLTDRSNPYFQTDTVINPGNSGGPLINVRGEVIGVNSAIYRGQANINVWQGVGLAIPSNYVSRVFHMILKTGRPVLGYLGLVFDEHEEGVVVSKIFPGSPAEVAGIKPGDAIVSYAGKEVPTPADMMRSVQNSEVGMAQPLEIQRDGKPLKLQATPVERPNTLAELIKTGGETAEYGAINDLLDIQMDELPPEARAAIKNELQFNASVYISGVRPGTAAARYLRPGDVLVGLNGQMLKSPADFTEQVKGLKLGSTAELVILRGWKVIHYRMTIQDSGI